MATVPLDVQSEDAEALAPFRSDCPRCGVDVLVVELAGQDVVLDVEEMLETVRCPRCAGNLAQGKEAMCWRCGGSRVVGEPLPRAGVGVAVDEHGVARVWFAPRRHGEGVHRRHRCLRSIP